jgi:hypothetical protein
MTIPTDFTQPGVFAQFMLDCAASAATVIDPQYVFVGHYEWYKDQDFYIELQKQDPPWQIFIGAPSGMAEMDAPEQGKYKSVAELFFTIPADAPASLIPMMTQLAKLIVAWDTTFVRWAVGGNRNPHDVEWGDIQIRRHVKPNFVCSLKITLNSGFFVVPNAANPKLVPEVI